MKRYILEGLLLLLQIEIVMLTTDLQALHDLVRSTGTARASRQLTSEALCHAIDIACVLYFKKVLCLQRSAATVVLLRRHGFDACLVLGAQSSPFKAHAWVELNAIVVNDKPYVSQIYRELERC